MVRVRVVRHEPPGAVPGAVLGVAAGLLLGSIWAFGSGAVALAVTAVFLGLAAVLGVHDAWRRFGIALVALGALAGGGLVLLAWSYGW